MTPRSRSSIFARPAAEVAQWHHVPIGPKVPLKDQIRRCGNERRKGLRSATRSWTRFRSHPSSERVKFILYRDKSPKSVFAWRSAASPHRLGYERQIFMRPRQQKREFGNLRSRIPFWSGRIPARKSLSLSISSTQQTQGAEAERGHRCRFRNDLKVLVHERQGRKV